MDEDFRVYAMYAMYALHPTRLYLYILRRLPRHAPSGLMEVGCRLCVCVCVCDLS